MGKVTRKRHTAKFRARVALEAIKGEQTLAEIGAKHGIHLTMVAAGKKEAAAPSAVSVQEGSSLHAGARTALAAWDAGLGLCNGPTGGMTTRPLDCANGRDHLLPSRAVG